MKKFVLLACLVGGLLGLAEPPGSAPTPFEQRLEALDKRIGGVEDLRADFEQRKHTALLREPIVSSGAVLVKGDRVRWETRRPRASTMVIGDGEIRIYYPDAGVAEVYRAGGDVRELSGSPLPRLESLRARFDLKELDPGELGAAAEGDRFTAIELTPTGEELREHVALVRVLLDTDIPCVAKIELTDADGERTVIEFKSVRVNTGVEAGELELSLPEGTRISRPGAGGAAGQGR